MNGSADLLQLDRFLPYRAARLATALSRGLAAQYEARYQISVPEWRVLVHLTQESEISVRSADGRPNLHLGHTSESRQTCPKRKCSFAQKFRPARCVGEMQPFVVNRPIQI